MKYWSDIVKATLYKMGIAEDDDDATEFTDKMPIVANECLSMMANDLRPCLKKITIVNTERAIVTMPEDFLGFSGVPIILRTDKQIIYHPDIEYNDWNVITLPDVGVYTISYFARYGEIPSYIKQGDTGPFKTFDLTKSYTEKEYNEIFGLTPSESDEIVFNGIYSSVLDCLPTYMASQLIAQDDVQKSTILRNEFEVLAQRLETNIMYQNESFRSEGGWY